MEAMAPGGGTPIHTHDCEEVWLILSGSGTVFLQAKAREGGAAVMHPRGCLLAGRAGVGVWPPPPPRPAPPSPPSHLPTHPLTHPPPPP